MGKGPSNERKPSVVVRTMTRSRAMLDQRETQRSKKHTKDIGDGVSGGGSGGSEEAELVGGLFGGAGEEGSKGCDPNRVATKKRVAGEVGHGREEEG